MDTDHPTMREGPLLELELLLGGEEDERTLPGSLHAFGVAATGKSLCLNWFLSHHHLLHAVFSCVEGYSVRLMLETLLKQLLGVERRCETVSDFLGVLRQELEPGRRVVVVLQMAERLRDMEQHLLQAFLRLQELTGLNICCVFESRLEWTKFRPSQNILSPITVHFPQYSRDELTKIVATSLPGDMSLDFKLGYSGMVLNVFETVTRSATELLHIAVVNYQQYCEPVRQGLCGEGDVKKLWLNIEKPLRKCLSTVSLREISSKQYMAAQQEKETEEAKKQEESTDFRPLGTVNVNRITVELPYYSKFLLIAAYLASYNPQKSDKRFFVKHHGKQRKTTAMIKAKEKLNSQLTGPKQFPMDRMLAIFYNIVEDRVNPTANIYSQITSLVHLQLLTAVGLEQMDQPKYRCNVNLDFVRNICRTVQFDIYKYLYDYCS